MDIGHSHIGLYTECILCYFGIGHLGIVQWMSTFHLDIDIAVQTYMNVQCPFSKWKIDICPRNLCEYPLYNIEGKNRHLLYKPMSCPISNHLYCHLISSFGVSKLCRLKLKNTVKMSRSAWDFLTPFAAVCLFTLSFTIYPAYCTFL